MKKKIIVFLLSLFSCISLSAQELFDSLLNVYSTKYPQEKLYLHFDKSYYNLGETIWFKAYITANNTPSTISKTLYAELINSDGKILQRKTMPIIQGGAASNFDVADSNYNSKLYIRAYTSWMLNFDNSMLYIKPITIINTKANAKKLIVINSYSLTLFPEGGDLVENLNCKIAFKTNNQDGLPFNIGGNIIDSKEKVITTFSSIHDGMGFFYLQPLPNEKYTAVWKDKNGAQQKTTLPEAKRQGVALNISSVNKQLSYTIVRQAEAESKLKMLTVVAQINQQLVYAAKINLTTKTQATAPIPLDSLPDGVMQITVFNEAQIPIAERIYFVNNNSYFFNTDLHLIDKNINRHGKNVFQVDVGGNTLSNLSIAITDASFDAATTNNENIFSGFLLNNDLKGYVYNPAQYFISDEDSVKQQLDLVMLTNGWRRFTWQDLLSNPLPKITHQSNNYLSISGNVFGLTKAELSNKDIMGILKTSPNAANSIITIPVNSDGKFMASGLYFFDTAKLSYQINNDKDKVLTSKGTFSFNNGLEKPVAISSNSFSNLYFNLKLDTSILLKGIKQSALYRSQEEMLKTKTLETVVVKSKEKNVSDKINKEYTSGLFTSGNAKIFATEGDPLAQSSQTVLQYLQGKVAGLQIIINGNDGATIKRRNSNTDVFLNEMPTDVNNIQSISMSDVAMVKVFDPPFFGSIGGGAGGAVAVYTKKGSDANSSVQKLSTVVLQGYSSIKQFYMPDYENNNTTASDYRTTLYWNPFIFMDSKTKRITIPIFNNDNCKKFKVVIEGINELGQLTREEKFFE